MPLAALAFSCAEGGPAPIESSSADDLRTSEQEVVYGEDDRLDYYAHPDERLRELTAQSIVAMISANSIQVSGDTVTLRGRTLGDSYGLCEDELFRDQPTAASCSGTLIDDDLVLTAGHCVSNGCGNNRWVFNYFYQGEGDLHPITTDDVFDCERVVVQSAPGWGGGNAADYAIVQLDRPATPRFTPAAFNEETWPVSVGDSVKMVGFGSGLPAKLDDGGVVLDERRNDRTYFTATTDAFGGNSGSGVFDANYSVVGILVAGEQDYTSSGGCTRVAVLPESGGGQGGESVTYAILAVEDLCDEGWPSERLCSIAAVCGDGICSLGETADACPDDCEDNGSGGGWTCDPAYFAAGDGCDCDCGVYDPDCDDPDQEVFNCRPGEFCNGSGVCEDPVDGPVEPGDDVPDEWLCELDLYDAGDGCDCDCGAYDPDCDDPEQELYNCPPGAWCNDAGLCEDDEGPMVPDPPIVDDTPDAGEGDGSDGFGFGDILGGGGGNDGCATADGRRTGTSAVILVGLLLGLRRRR